MEIEIIQKTYKLSKSNAHWEQCRNQFLNLKDNECLKITGLSKNEINTLRQIAYRERHARCFVRIEEKKSVLYLYPNK